MPTVEVVVMTDPVQVVPTTVGPNATVEIQVPRIIQKAVYNLNGDPGDRILVKDTAPGVGDNLEIGDIWLQPSP